MKGKDVICLFCCVSLYLSGQSNHLKEEYENFKKKTRIDYTSFRDKANQEYSEWMKFAWKWFTADTILPLPNDEDIPPVIYHKKDTISIAPRPIPFDEVAPVPQEVPQPLPVNPILEEPTIKDEYIEFDYFGINAKIRFGKECLFELKSADNIEIANTWDKLSQKAYNNTIRDCLEFRIHNDLCDWAFILFLENLSKSCFEKPNEQNLFMAYILCQVGYKIRLAKSDDKLFFMLCSPHFIYGAPSFKIGDDLFYAYNCKETTLEIFNYSFPNEQTLSLWITQQPKFGVDLSSERIIQSQQYPDFRVKTRANKNLIKFYDTYPTSVVEDNVMTRWAMYANTPMASEVTQLLYPQIKRIVSGLSEKDGVNRVLNLIQTGLVYEYDDKVWGHDRAFFAEETLFYPYCDCEDRSILFSRLVRDIFDLDVILVFYPGHLATAVCFNENVPGDYIILGDKKYIICDPTYIGAPIGLTMPNMDNTSAKVILLKR